MLSGFLLGAGSVGAVVVALWRWFGRSVGGDLDMSIAVEDRLRVLWESGTQRSRAETAGFLLAEIDKTLQAWIEED